MHLGSSTAGEVKNSPLVLISSPVGLYIFMSQRLYPTMKTVSRLLLLATFTFGPHLGFSQSTEEWAAGILKAIERRQAFPALADQAYNATERQAYQVQKAVVERLVDEGDEIVGHKAGLTSNSAQARFDAFEPVAGTLLKSHVKNTATFVSQRRYRGMVVEMEIGFELKLSIRSAPRDLEDLKSKVRQVYPIVELPNILFEPDDRIGVLDVIASNVAAATVIKGRPKPFENLDLAAVEATLTRDDEVVSEGVGSDALGDPWEALMWLVRNRLQEGYEVKRNDLLITGALGKVVRAERGRYVADFGELGRVTFTTR